MPLAVRELEKLKVGGRAGQGMTGDTVSPQTRKESQQGQDQPRPPDTGKERSREGPGLPRGPQAPEDGASPLIRGVTASTFTP